MDPPGPTPLECVFTMARVLVVDDSPLLVELVAQALSAEGIQTEKAIDLATLDQRLAAEPFDLILVDINMPEMFGDDVVEFLKSQRKTKAQLILYSDMAEAELAARVGTSGADGYLLKAWGIERCVQEVRKRLVQPPAAPKPRL